MLRSNTIENPLTPRYVKFACNEESGLGFLPHTKVIICEISSVIFLPTLGDARVAQWFPSIRCESQKIRLSSIG